MDDVLNHLKAGILRFQTEVYPARAEQYHRAMSEPQRPDALIVTCADSRIHPDLLTQAQPGELFVTRNIGNMVPAYGEMMGAMSAVLEYAVSALGVKHVVVCGHTDCGAMKALLDPASVEAMPTVKKWLRNAHAALSVAEALQNPHAAQEDLLRVVTEQNVLLQMRHVRTHPSVAGALARGELTISGWVYDIAHGQVSICDEEERNFLPVTQENMPSARRERVVDAAVGASLNSEHFESQ
jgi:carbonic anhydrase